MIIGRKDHTMVAIRLDAGHKRGMGHLFRMMILAHYLKSQGYKVVFLIKENSIASRILIENSFLFQTFPRNSTEVDIIKQSCCEYNIQLWIFDLLDTETKWIKLIRQMSRFTKILCFDDLKGGPCSADLVINPIFGCWNEIQLKYKGCSNVLNGPDYAILPPDLFDYQSKTNQDFTGLNIGLTMGGSDTYGTLVNMAQILTSICDESYLLSFFTGPHFLHMDQLNRSLGKSRIPWHIHHNVPNLIQELSNMDFVICSGGQTLFELLAIGKPVLAIANEKHEQKTIQFLDKIGACLNLGYIENGVDIEKLKNFYLR